MTMSPGEPGPTDFEGRAVPPYEGRQEGADVDDEASAHRDGAEVGGATGPAESAERRSPDPERAGRAAGTSPSEERPAEESGGNEPGEASVGPAHVPGTARGEDQAPAEHRRDGDAERNVGG
jgi:hypothetical protein